MPFEFTQDAYRDFSDKILKAEGDQATLTSLLADMQGTYVDQLALHAQQEKEVEAVKAENERLKASNMELFLRVGESVKNNTQSQTSEPDEPEEMDVEKYMENYYKKE